MKVVVIGGCGHIGSYLVPRLIKAGYEVTNITRGQSRPYVQDRAWDKVEQVILDRGKEKDFAQKVAGMDADIVVDLINFHIEDTKEMVEVLKGTRLSHYLFCSTIWTHGRAEVLSAAPNCLKAPLDDYGLNKYQSELYLKEQYRTNGFPATIIMPGQISGPGWIIINPYGNVNTHVFEKIAKGEKIYLPNFGVETLHHVHAADVAQMFFKAITHRNQALGESFHAVAEDSLTLYGYANVIYEFFGQEPQIDFLSWEKWCDYIGNKEEAETTYYHIARSGHYSIENAKRLIDYQPQYSTRETVEISIQSYIDRGIITKE
ncbi:NAD-dependent epimerase/dehydratase family protein [Kineothrix sp. MB12-C1]|uniref:NAD-dependent epimerase/dehydratase family protein n=1 Tax=Kineothrix sp. MB12-C1 TaxID=3070215 RepID=UPI0027D33B54|nr:NAD-dependent epimerase/dehydratase family protein [Kineothrix sp. MB12-C1]WMC92582.1 NAD-dependent epimerase/dehydratase family protein [Kineothrix sp. MB12-C1]